MNNDNVYAIVKSCIGTGEIMSLNTVELSWGCNFTDIITYIAVLGELLSKMQGEISANECVFADNELSTYFNYLVILVSGEISCKGRFLSSVQQ